MHTQFTYQVKFHSVAWLLSTGTDKFKLRSPHLTSGIRFFLCIPQIDYKLRYAALMKEF